MKVYCRDCDLEFEGLIEASYHQRLTTHKPKYAKFLYDGLIKYLRGFK